MCYMIFKYKKIKASFLWNSFKDFETGPGLAPDTWR